MREAFDFDAIPEADNRYSLEECVGAGVYGKVFRAKDTQAGQKKVAIKTQRFTEENEPFIQEEYRILRDFSNHPNLPEFYGIYKQSSEEGQEIWFVMELCEGGPVTDLVKGLIFNHRRMAEEHIALILKEVVKALIHLHENKVLHRDIKANNILLTKEGDIKLVDFGLSRLLKSTLGKTASCLGSPSWMAPEVVKAQDSHDYEGYDNRADVWSLGITALELADGTTPFQDMHPTRAMFQIVRNPPPHLTRPGNWSATFNDFISECLVKNPEHRPYMVELLEHPFFTEIPENNYYLTQELKVLYQKYSEYGSEQRTPEFIVHSNLLKTGENEELEQMQVEDLSTLEELNEEAILQELHNRLKEGQSCTFIGDILLILHPNEQQHIYGEEQHYRYRFKSRSDNAPHIYSVADSAYQAALHHKTEQHILLAGESCSGKTTNYLHIVDHLLYLGQNKNINQERISNGIKLLHAFIHASTPTNDYSTRCMFHTEIVYGSTGKNTGARFEINQIEKWRVSSTDMAQSNFHVMYYFYDGIQETGELSKYYLSNDRQYRYLRISQESKSNCPRDNPKQNARKYEKILDIFKQFDFDNEEIQTILNTLAAIINLGEIRFQETTQGKAEVINEESVSKVARLLQVDEKKFLWSLTNYCIVKEETAVRERHNCEQARDARDVLANTLYCRIVQYVVNIINSKLSYGIAIFGEKYSIKILDFYGFESFKENSLSQLLINCSNELLQYHYLQRIFAWEALETNEENIPYKPIYYYDNKQALEEMLGKFGILNFINEASKQGKGGKSVMDRLENQENIYVNKINDSEFYVNHYTGKVIYYSKEMPDRNHDFLPPDITETLKISNNPIIKMLFSNKLNKAGNLCIPPENINNQAKVSMLEEGGLIKQQYSQTRNMRSASATFKAYCIDLLKELSVGGGAGGAHYVRCLRSDLQGNPRGFYKEIVKQQLRAMAVLETAKSRQKGFPHRIPFPEFLRRYKFLAFDFDENIEISKDNCRLLLIRLKMEGWAIGKTKVFLKYYNEEYLSRLYETQVNKVIKIQAMIRSYLARRKMIKKMKLRIKDPKPQQNEKNDLTEEEAAIVVQKAYRNYSAKKIYGKFSTNCVQFDEELTNFIRFFYNKWRSKTIFQVLLQYRAARYQDLYNLSQQVHLYNQNAVKYFQECSKIDLEGIDSKAQPDIWLGNKKPSVLKLPFRLNEIPYFDTSYMCEPLTITESAVEKEDESWDAAFRWRETISSQITSSMQANNEKLAITSKCLNQLIELPYTRNPEELTQYISSPTVIDSEEEKQDELNINDKSDDVYYTQKYNYLETSEDVKKLETSQLSNINNNTTSANKDFEFIRPPSTTKVKPRAGYINPIAELETKGRRQNNTSDDDPPFNFQAMLRKTNFKRNSIKREDENSPKFEFKLRKDFHGENKNGSHDKKDENKQSEDSVPADDNKLLNDTSDIGKTDDLKENSVEEMINNILSLPSIEENGYLKEEIPCTSKENNSEKKCETIRLSPEVISKTELIPGIIMEGFVVNL